jgi:hypothetical protein
VSDVIGYTSAQAPEFLNLDNFATTSVVSVRLPRGLYIAFGKGVLRNFDGDFQNATLWLRQSDGHPEGPFQALDHSQVTIDENGEASTEAATVQSAVIVEEESFVDVAADTFNGGVACVQLAVIKLDELNPRPG